jgi:hypothetical protein
VIQRYSISTKWKQATGKLELSLPQHCCCASWHHHEFC